MDNETYESPLCTRYASKEMQYIFSAQKKWSTSRRLWTALARAEMNLGLPVTAEQVAELENHVDDIDFEAAARREKEVRHDVMAHIYAYGLVCPKAKGIIHLGATSCYVGDNTDIIVMRDALRLLLTKISGVIGNLRMFALKYRALPCLAYTHLQPAQLTTVGKRAALWLNELFMDYEELTYRADNLKLLGQKGTTGTQASFMELFGGDEAKIDELERQICVEMGFKAEQVVPVSGQTYSRKVDYQVLSALSGVAQSASKFASDIRILASFKEIEEPFETQQVGSSAMPYKRNPMRCERISSLSRYIITAAMNPALTAASQWFERTLDDSANKRIAVAESFLATDAMLGIMLNVTKNLVVYPKVIESRVMKELPFMATENIMMRASENGGDRQELHERIREHAMAASRVVKEAGGENDLIRRIAADPLFNLSEEEISDTLKPELYIGRCVTQVERFAKFLAKAVPLSENPADFELNV